MMDASADERLDPSGPNANCYRLTAVYLSSFLRSGISEKWMFRITCPMCQKREALDNRTLRKDSSS